MGNKYISAIAVCLLFVSTIFSLSSCKDEEEWFEGYGMVEKLEDNSFNIIMDDGKLLIPKESIVHPSDVTDSTRMHLSFNIIDTYDSCYDVRINWAQKILTKQIIPYSEAILDSIGNDPIKISGQWIAHGFLNFEFIYPGGFPQPQVKHTVNLLQFPTENNTLMFEFRHNGFKDPQVQLWTGVISFPLHNLIRGMKKPVKMKITYLESANKTQTIELTYP